MDSLPPAFCRALLALGAHPFNLLRLDSLMGVHFAASSFGRWFVWLPCQGRSWRGLGGRPGFTDSKRGSRPGSFSATRCHASTSIPAASCGAISSLRRFCCCKLAPPSPAARAASRLFCCCACSPFFGTPKTGSAPNNKSLSEHQNPMDTHTQPPKKPNYFTRSLCACFSELRGPGTNSGLPGRPSRSSPSADAPDRWPSLRSPNGRIGRVVRGGLGRRRALKLYVDRKFDKAAGAFREAAAGLLSRGFGVPFFERRRRWGGQAA